MFLLCVIGTRQLSSAPPAPVLPEFRNTWSDVKWKQVLLNFWFKNSPSSQAQQPRPNIPVHQQPCKHDTEHAAAETRTCWAAGMCCDMSQWVQMLRRRRLTVINCSAERSGRCHVHHDFRHTASQNVWVHPMNGSKGSESSTCEMLWRVHRNKWEFFLQ